MMRSLAIIMGSGIISIHMAYAQPLKLGFGNNETYPLKWKEEGKYVGVYIDIIKEVTSRSGIEIEIEPYPHKRLLQYLKNGKIDGAIGLYKTHEREQFATYADIPIAWIKTGVFIKKGHLSSIKAFSDLNGKMIGKVRGITFNKNIQKAIDEGEFSFEETATYKQSIRKLLAGRIDALVAPNFSTQYLLQEMGVSKEILLLPFFLDSPSPVYALFSKSSMISEKKSMIEKITKILADMEQEKRFDEILYNYNIH